MKKLLLLLIPVLLGGCKKNFNNIIDSQPSNYQVKGTAAADQFKYVPYDSLMAISITLTSSEGIKNVFINVYDPDNNLLNDSPVELLDNGDVQNGDTTKGDNTYSNKFPLSHYYLKGTYQIKFYITDISDNTNLAAVHSFVFDNGQANIAPVISKLVMPDSISVGETFIFTVTASDSNGLIDIAYVDFQLYRPDGAQVKDNNGNALFYMQDDGDYLHFGDNAAGDGVYSYKNSFASTAPSGSWKFVFQAKDRSGLLSNIITHNIIVK